MAEAAKAIQAEPSQVQEDREHLSQLHSQLQQLINAAWDLLYVNGATQVACNNYSIVVVLNLVGVVQQIPMNSIWAQYVW